MMIIISTAHAATLRVGVIDTGLDLTDGRFASLICPTGSKDFTGKGIQDDDDHGTHVTGIIKEWAKDSDYCLVILKYYESATEHSHYPDALREAVNQHLDIVNISSSGTDYEEDEKDLICNNPDTKFFVAAGNDHKDIDKVPYYPASLPCKNILSVGSYDSPTSNYGDSINIWEEGYMILSTLPYGQKGYMTGTSMAAPAATGKWIYLMTHWDN